MFKTNYVNQAGQEIDAFVREEITKKCERCSKDAKYYVWTDKPSNHTIKFYCERHKAKAMKNQ
jgi:hypothetical protein